MPTDGAFKALYDEHVRMVFNLCLNHLRDRDEAAEATQDVFVKVHQRIEGFKGGSSIRTWIYRVAINTCLDRIKAARRKKRSYLGVPLVAEGRHIDLPGTDHPGVRLEDKERMDALLRRIDALPTAQRTALLLRSTEGLGVQEIAQVMRLSEKAVESLLSRARAALKDLRTPPKD